MATAKKAAPAKKAAAKKAAPAKKASPANKPIARPKILDVQEPGFIQGSTRLFLPTSVAKPVVVPSNKLREGLEAAQGQIKKTLQGFASVFTQDFEVAEISLTLSFNAEGKFLGFGAGGAMSVAIKIVPTIE